MKFPILQSQLSQLFGTPRDPAPYLKVIDLREFSGHLGHVKDFTGKPWSGRIYGHELLEAPLQAAFGRLCGRGFAGELRTYDGCVCIRKMKGGAGYSVHSWGLAIDVNAGSNPFGGRPALSDGFVRCFAECGFEWGGLWRPDSLRDGMHFQLPWIRVRTDGNPLNPVAWEGEPPKAPREAQRPDQPEEAAAKQYRVTASRLNIRSGPGADYEILGQFTAGAIVTEAQENDGAPGWIPVLLSNGETAWLARRYLEGV